MIIKITSSGAYIASKQFMDFLLMLKVMKLDCKTLEDLDNKVKNMFELYTDLAIKDEENMLSKKEIKKLKEDKKYYEKNIK